MNTGNQSLLRRVSLAAGARAISLPVTGLSAIVTTYLTVHYAGADAFGYISLIGTLFLLFPFADLGLGAAILTTVAQRGGDPAHDLLARDAYRRAFVALSGVATLIVVASVLLGVLGAWHVLLGIPAAYGSQADLSAGIAFGVFGLSIPFGIGQRLLVGVHKTHLSSLLQAITPVVAIGVTVLLMAAQMPAVELAVSTPIGILTASVISTLAGLRSVGWTVRSVVGRERPIGPSRVRLLSTAMPMLVVMIGAPFAMQSHRILLSHLSTTESLAQYSAAAQFYAPALSIVTTGAMAMWPHFAQQAASADPRRELRAGLLIMTTGGLTGGALLAVLLAPVTRLVTGGRIDLPLLLCIGFGLLLLLMATHQVAAMYLTDAVGLRFQAACIVAFAVASIALSIALIPSFGSAGPALGSAAALLATTVIPCIIYCFIQVRRRTLIGRAASGNLDFGEGVVP